MTLDKHEQQVVAAEVERLRTSEHAFDSVDLVNDYGQRADALEAILPKPRFHTARRYVYDRHDRVWALYVTVSTTQNAALAAIIAQDIADVLNKRLGEEA